MLRDACTSPARITVTSTCALVLCGAVTAHTQYARGSMLGSKLGVLNRNTV